MSSKLSITIKGCRQEEIQSQEELYRLYYPEMIKICFRYASDADGAGTIYNNAMLKVFKSIDQYTEEGKLLQWIKTIVINCSIDFCKKKNIFKQSVPYVSEMEPCIEPDVFHKVSGKEVQQVIRELPPATAIIFNLFLYDGFTHKQIAAALSISENTSKWHVREAKRILKQKFTRFSQNESIIHEAG